MAKFWVTFASHVTILAVIYIVQAHNATRNATQNETESMDTQISKYIAKRVHKIRPMHLTHRSWFHQSLRQASDLNETDLSCNCSQVYDPVCASNNHSYSNLCHMECDARYFKAEIVVEYEGLCLPF
ncbi:uncharacterized protein LOC142977320 [Anticarsia gemmatalis]|uniref:uncharacterized protein LOC142977320 n=1 Tax=Anticarsia gemmatalis TaxID=129554 RepID=UPI003F776233